MENRLLKSNEQLLFSNFFLLVTKFIFFMYGIKKMNLVKVKFMN